MNFFIPVLQDERQLQPTLMENEIVVVFLPPRHQTKTDCDSIKKHEKSMQAFALLPYVISLRSNNVGLFGHRIFKARSYVAGLISFTSVVMVQSRVN